MYKFKLLELFSNIFELLQTVKTNFYLGEEYALNAPADAAIATPCSYNCQVAHTE